MATLTNKSERRAAPNTEKQTKKTKCKHGFDKSKCKNTPRHNKAITKFVRSTKEGQQRENKKNTTSARTPFIIVKHKTTLENKLGQENEEASKCIYMVTADKVSRWELLYIRTPCNKTSLSGEAVGEA